MVQPLRDQATHFVGYTKRPNVDNSSDNHKNVRNTYNVGPTICVSFVKERKTQVGWVATVGRKA
jgi:hypothetical protein